MVISPSEVIELGSYAYKLKQLIAEHEETEAKLYRMISELVNDVEDLESIRIGDISNSLPHLDSEIVSLQSGLDDVLHRYEKALAEHRSASFIGKAKSYINISKVKEQIQQMDNQVNRVKQRFMVRTQIMQTTMSATQFSAVYNVQENVAALQQELDELVHNASRDRKTATQMFGVEKMSTPKRKQSLRKASLDLATASEDADRKTLELKIRILEEAIKKDTDFLEPEKTVPPEDLRVECTYVLHQERNGHERDDAIVEVITLLRSLQDSKSYIVPIIFFHRGSQVATSLSDLGYREEALLLAKICHGVVQKLVSDHEETYLYALASSFYSRSRIMEKAGLPEEAIDEGREAVKLFGKLAIKYPQPFTFPLATCLTTLCQQLIKLNRYGSLAPYVQRTTNIWTSLSARKPSSEAVNYHLGLAYYNMNLFLGHIGKHEKAQKFGQLAVDIFSNLARKYPEYHIEAFADALHNLSETHDQLGELEDAVQAEQKAIDVFTPTIRKNSGAAQGKLADMYLNMGAYSAKLGRIEQAIVSTQKSLDLLVDLATNDSESFNTKLADTYSNLSSYLSVLGRFDEAFAAAAAGMKIREVLAKDPRHSEEALRDLARSSMNLCFLFSKLGQFEKAFTCAKGAVEIMASLDSKYPDRYGADLAFAYQNTSNVLYGLGQVEEAKEYVQKTVDMLGSLEASEQRRRSGALVQAHHNLSVLSSESMQSEKPVTPMEGLTN